MVPGAGLEPARCYHQGIFIPATAFAARRDGVFGVWTLPLPWRNGAVGRSRQVSTLSRRTGLSSGLPPFRC
jgi:hypothetical protein